MGYSRKPSYHFNSEADVIGDVPLNRTIVCNSFLGVPSVSFKYITSSSASTIKAAYEAGNLEPIKSVLTSSAAYPGNLLGTHASTLKFFTDIYSGVADENVSLTLALSGALDSQLVLKDTNALWIEYTGSCTFDEALATYGIYLKEKAAAQAQTKYIYGCVSLENSSLTWSADITSNGTKNSSGEEINALACAFNSYLKAVGVIVSGASGNGVSINTSRLNFSNSTSQNNGNSGIYSGNGSFVIGTYAFFLNNGTTGFSSQHNSAGDINGSTVTGNGNVGVYAESSKIYVYNSTISNNTYSGIYAVTNSFVSADNSTIDGNNIGVNLLSSKATIDSTTITNSTLSGVVALTSSTLNGNNATISNNGDNGAFISGNSSLITRYSTFDSNAASNIQAISSSYAQVMDSTISNSSGHGIHAAYNSCILINGANVTNSGAYGVYVDTNSLLVNETTGSITGSAGSYDLAISVGSYIKISTAINYGNSNITANTHYTDGSYLKK